MIRRHVFVALAFAVAELGVYPAWPLVFSALVKPRLQVDGARPCADVAAAHEFNGNCDVAIERVRNGVSELVFWSRDGREKTTVRSVGGAFLSSRTEYWSNWAALPIPLIGGALLTIAVTHKMLRTRSLFTWQMARHEWDRFEKVMLLYAVLFMGAGVLSIALSRRL